VMGHVYRRISFFKALAALGTTPKEVS
jgi:hypothetical protein